MAVARRWGVPLELAIRFAETDAMGVVHHSVYAVWLEAGRVEWMNAAGIPYADVAARGFNFAVTGLTIEYLRPLVFGDTAVILTQLATLRSRKVSFEYQVRSVQHDKVCAVGHTEHICVDDTGGAVRIPSDALAVMRVAMNSEAKE